MRRFVKPVGYGVAVLLLGATSAAGQAGECSGGAPAFGSLGIGEFRCIGGSCAVNMRSGDPYAHSFSTEPRIRNIDPEGPGAGVLRNDDVLVAIDGKLITTAEGGRRLGSIRPGQDVSLTLRRNGREISAWLTAEASCELPRLSVTSGAGWDAAPSLGYVFGDSTYRSTWSAPDSMFRGAFMITDSAYRAAWRFSDSAGLVRDSLAFPLNTLGTSFVPGVRDTLDWARPLYLMADSAGYAFGITTSPLARYALQDSPTPAMGLAFGPGPRRPPVEFGVELSCGECGWRTMPGGSTFRTREFPTIESVEKDGPADRAGLLPGDIMISVAGSPITSDEAGRHLGGLSPGEAVTIEIRRGDRILEISIAPREASGRRQRM